MSEIALLEIQLAPSMTAPLPGTTAWNVLRGGPSVLLRWLETQLGLPNDSPPLSNRVLELAAGLDRHPAPSFARSLAADRWGTAHELLTRYDELRLAGWDGEDSAALPPLVRDLAIVLQQSPLRFPDRTVRLQRILAALDRGQRLPPHRVLLWDAPELWPARWQPVLARLATEVPADAPPAGAPGSALAIAQEAILGGEIIPIRPDPSLRWLRSRSVPAAGEMVAQALAADPTLLPGTVVCCEDPAVALVLDGCLARLGLPTMGVKLPAASHPVLQVLPLILRLCWEPVDPKLLLDFVALPVGPIPRRAAGRLAAALAQQPGFGSGAWREAVRELTDPAKDPEGSVKARLEGWFAIQRQPWGNPLPLELLTERCGRVAQWATGRARRLDEDADADPRLAEVLRTAAAQAAALKELLETQGTPQSEPQLARLLDAALPDGIAVQPRLEACGGPRCVTSLAEIAAPCARLVWLGLGTAERVASRWSVLDRERLRAAGIDLDDGSRLLTALRRAERRGLLFVAESLLAMALPADEELRPHPLWLQVRGGLAAATIEAPVDLEPVLTGAGEELAPWRITREASPVLPPQPRRPSWTLAPGLLRDRTGTSATELATRLACPLQWVLNYAARLEPGDLVALPDEFQIKGSFGHEMLSLVAGPGGEPLAPQAAEESVLAAFDGRLGTNAAPLAQPARLTEALRLKRELAAAARVLAGALRAGGYRIVGFEVAITGQAFGRDLAGSIDCLVRRPDGEEAIIDFKYAGRNKYRLFLEEGRAIQLATYAYARRQGSRFPAVAYLILADGLLLTPEGSPLRDPTAAQVVAGPAMAEVWGALTAAVPGADAWLAGDEPVPARPLQDPSEWPTGVALAIYDPKPVKAETRQPCCYCDYQLLCGFTQLT